MIEKRAYEKAVFDIIEADSEDFLKGAYKDEAKERILKIIEIEAPITEALLSKRLINSFSIKRLGSSLSEYFDSLMSNGCARPKQQALKQSCGDPDNTTLSINPLDAAVINFKSTVLKVDIGIAILNLRKVIPRNFDEQPR